MKISKEGFIALLKRGGLEVTVTDTAVIMKKSCYQLTYKHPVIDGDCTTDFVKKILKNLKR